MLKEHIEYILIWEFRVSSRSVINISRMIYPQKEKEFFLSEEYLKKLETKEEYDKESKKRYQIKRDNEKFKINTVVTGFDRQSFKTAGPSIFRHQIPDLINALQDIHTGKHDPLITTILREAGIIKNTS